MKIRLEDAIAHFLMSQELKGNSKKTIAYYRNNVGYYMEYAGADKPVDEINLASLQGYYLHVKNRKSRREKKSKDLPSVSIQSYMRAVRVFATWLYTEGYLQQNLAEKFKLPKASKKQVDILSEPEIKLLFDACNLKTTLGIRKACIIALMVDCGLRRQEVCNLNYTDIHLTMSSLKVVDGKGAKDRIVPIGRITSGYLMKYMNNRPMPDPTLQDEFQNRLFFTKDRKPLSEDSIKQLFKGLKDRTGIHRLHPHLLRHTFATKYLMNGGDTFSLQMILGHTSIEMVKKYSHLASSYIIASHKSRSPLDNMRR